MSLSSRRFSRSTVRRSSLTAAAAGVAVLLAACSSASGGSSAPKPVAPSGLVSSLSPAKGDVGQITWNLYGEPDTLDPDNAADYSSGTVVRNLCDTLLSVDANYNVHPDLATYKLVSPTEIVFTLRKGVTFWDGKPVTAEDLVYDMQRAANPNFISAFIFTNVKSVTVSGPQQVTVTFKHPDELFISEMANMTVMEKSFSEKAGQNLGTPSGGLMCSGPYELKKWTSGTSIVLTRNDHYWNPALKPFAKTVVFSFLSDSTTLATALNTGEVDGAYQIPPAAVPTLQKSSQGRLTFGPSMESLSLEQANPAGVMANAKIREALEIGIDRPGLAAAVFHGAAAPVYTSLTPATWPNDVKSIYQAAYNVIAKQRAYDPAKAKQLISESGYSGRPIVLAYESGDASAALTAQLVQQEASAMGLNVKLSALQPLIFLQAGYDATKRAGIDILLAPNFNTAHDPLELIELDYLARQPYNYTNFNDPQASADIEKADATFNDAQRAGLIVKAQSIYEATNSIIPLVSTYTTSFLKNSLTGAVTSFAYWSMPSMAYIGAPS